MSLRQFVRWESPGNGRRGFFFPPPHTQTGEDSKKWTCENGIAVFAYIANAYKNTSAIAISSCRCHASRLAKFGNRIYGGRGEN